MFFAFFRRLLLFYHFIKYLSRSFYSFLTFIIQKFFIVRLLVVKTFTILSSVLYLVNSFLKIFLQTSLNLEQKFYLQKTYLILSFLLHIVKRFLNVIHYELVHCSSSFCLKSLLFCQYFFIILTSFLLYISTSIYIKKRAHFSTLSSFFYIL